jgi:hypothetical protein
MLSATVVDVGVLGIVSGVEVGCSSMTVGAVVVGAAVAISEVGGTVQLTRKMQMLITINTIFRFITDFTQAKR